MLRSLPCSRPVRAGYPRVVATRTARTRRGNLRALVDIWVDLFDEHNLLTYASAIAMQALVAAVALVLLVLGVLHAASEEQIWTNHVAPAVQTKVLEPVFAGINATVLTIFSGSSAGLIAFASVLAIWEVSGVVRACMGALDQIYETQDDRPWWIRFPLSWGLATALIAAFLGALGLGLIARTAVHGSWGLPFAIFRWVAAVLLLAAAFELLVRFAPAEARPKKWVTAGTTLVVVLWIVQSLIFAWYVKSVANFRTPVGTLAMFFVLTSYVYVGAIVLLVAMELDEQLRRDVKSRRRGMIELVRGLF
jgi:membrane protein